MKAIKKEENKNNNNRMNATDPLNRYRTDEKDSF